jgi:hypothetical protein
MKNRISENPTERELNNLIKEIEGRRQTVRLWVWINDSPVKLTLHNMEPVRFGKSGPTDEGYHSERTTLEYDGEEGKIYRYYHEDGSDCDGRLERESESETTPALKYSGNDYTDETGQLIRFPHWTTTTSGQRDYTAEAAGY